MKDGAIVSNAGHFNVEIDMEALDRCADEIYEARHNIDAYRLPNGKTIYVIAQGRLVNLAAGDGHPAEIMDMSFAVQAMSAEYLVRMRGQLRPGVVSVPAEIDDNIARRKLKAMGVSIDSLSCSQKESSQRLICNTRTERRGREMGTIRTRNTRNTRTTRRCTTNSFALLDQHRMKALSQKLNEMNEFDISEFSRWNSGRITPQRMAMVFRILSKEIAASVFANLQVEEQETIINSITDTELAGIIEELYVDDAVDMMRSFLQTSSSASCARRRQLRAHSSTSI